MKILTAFLILFTTTLSFAQEYCESGNSEPLKLVKVAQEVVEKLYVDIASLKIKHGGDGKLSILYEKGVPKDLMLKYKDMPPFRISFEDLKSGKPLVFEDREKVPGPAIVITRAPGEAFGEGGKYKFVLALRNKMTDQNKVSNKGMEFSSSDSVKALKDSGYMLQELNYSSAPPPTLSSASNPKVSKITINPGISGFSWDGTFKEINFQ